MKTQIQPIRYKCAYKELLQGVDLLSESETIVSQKTDIKDFFRYFSELLRLRELNPIMKYWQWEKLSILFLPKELSESI